MASTKRINSGNGRTAAKAQPAAKSRQTSKTQTAKKSRPASETRTDKTRQAKSPEKYVPTKKEIKLRNEIKLLAALTFMILAELSCFGFLSPVGDYIGFFIFGCFGIIGYILPILIFLGVAFLLSNRNSRNAIIKLVAAAALLFWLIALIHLIFIGYESGHGAGYYYMFCGRGKTGGGFFGGLISNTLCSLIGTIGTYIVLIILTIVCLILITERSFIGGVRSGSKKLYKTAVNDVERIRESAENYSREKNYQKNRRINRKVKGVNLTKLENPDVQDEDIHEITGAVPENASIHYGRIEEDDIEAMDNASSSLIAAENQPEYDTSDKASYNGIIQPSELSGRYEASSLSLRTEQGILHPSSNTELYEPPQEDEEGFFKPKEKIEVSESARNVMSRKLYTGGSVSSGNTAAVNDTATRSGAVSRPGDKAAAVSGADSGGNPGAVNAASGAHQKKKAYVLPKTTLLVKGERSSRTNDQELKNTAYTLENIFKNFGVTVEVTEYHKGPSVTRYEVQPEIGTRLSKITALADDIKLNLAATDIRIEPIPGKSTIGIEVPNKKREPVLIRDLIESAELMNNKSKIAFAAGMDIAGAVIVSDIAKMPHMLVAGTTGSGKSVFTNSIIMSILFRATPDEVRLIIVDPKVVEFGVYNGIPHLLQPVVTDPRLASNTLKWAVNEMSERYKKFADLNVRDLKGYNDKQSDEAMRMPQIVIVIDELADLMMVAAKEVEESICRLAQLARAAGIHLIIATQRPSVDVVTGLIKANIPSRVALMVSSGVDSRTIIDSNGAEKLLGNGDMLFYPSGYLKPVRLQGAFVSDDEVQRVVDFWKNQAGDITYDSNVADFVASQPVAGDNGMSGDGRDEYFAEAARFCIEKEKASTTMIQRMFKIGFNRASRIMEQMEEAGVVSVGEGPKPRRVLMTIEEFEQKILEGKDEV